MFLVVNNNNNNNIYFILFYYYFILIDRLLLADLIKHTDDSHPDKPTLVDTLQQISDLAENVNGDMRRQENLQKQLKLQRAFVGTVVKQRTTKKKNTLIHKQTNK